MTKNHHAPKGKASSKTVMTDPEPSFETKVFEMFETLKSFDVTRSLELMIILAIKKDATKTMNDFAEEFEVTSATMTPIPKRLEGFVNVERKPQSIGKFLTSTPRTSEFRDEVCRHFSEDQLLRAWSGMRSAKVTAINAALTLVHAYLDDGLPFSDLPGLHGFSSPSATMHADRLDESGLIDRVRGSVDRRRWTVILTGKGNESVENFFDALGR